MGGSNLYAYSGNAPTNYIDPAGTCPAGETEPIGGLDKESRDAHSESFAPGTSPIRSSSEQKEATEKAREQIVDLTGDAVGVTAPELEFESYAFTHVFHHFVIHPIAEKAFKVAAGEPGGGGDGCQPKQPGGSEPGSNEPPPGRQPPASPRPGDLVPPDTPGGSKPVPGGGSIDPNGKLTSGYGDQGFVPPNTPILYTIYFENQPTATAPAEEVVVTDPLAANLDWSTVQLSQIQFNSTTINVPAGQQTYTGQVSVSTDPNPVSVNAALNPSTGVLSWTMQSVNPATGGLPTDPLAGFLPPNNASNQGTGYVTFTVRPKSGLSNGTAINNQATIVFDANAPISTNTVTNTIDSVDPTSSIGPLPATTTSPSFPVTWSGSDPAGAGIASYNIYVSINSGAYSIWLASTTATSAIYNGVAGLTYSFYSIATDNAGNIQQTPGPIQTTIAGQAAASQTITFGALANQTYGATPITLTATASSGLPVTYAVTDSLYPAIAG